MCRERQSMSMFIRSEEELASFYEFCIDNPQLRFWQALLAWVEATYAVESLPHLEPGDSVGAIYVAVDEQGYGELNLDTFYWEWANKGLPEYGIGPFPGIGPQRKDA